MEIRNEIIRKHLNYSREGTNNLIFYLASFASIDDKKRFFPESIKKSLNFGEEIYTMFEYRSQYIGIYNRMFQMCLISLCSDIEFFLKEYYDFKQIAKGKGRGYFQRFEDVIKDLMNSNYNFSNISSDINNIIKAFQIRHICIHNMGYVDNNFNSKYPNVLIDTLYIVSEDEYKNCYESYQNFLYSIDTQTI